MDHDDLPLAIHYFRAELEAFYQERRNHFRQFGIELPATLDLQNIAKMYGTEKLMEQYNNEMQQLEDVDPFPTEDPQGRTPSPSSSLQTSPPEPEVDPPVQESTQVSAEEGPDFDQLIESVEKVSSKKGKKFGYETAEYSVKFAPLLGVFDNARAIELLPKLFKALFSKLTDGFEDTDRIAIEMGNAEMEFPFLLRVRKFCDFNPNDLLAKVEQMNSKKAFCIDESFFVRVSRTRIPSGGSYRMKNVHTKIDRRAKSKSVVSVKVGSNLCLPAALVLGKFHATEDLRNPIKHTRWKTLINPKRTNTLETEARNLVTMCGFKVGRKFSIEDIEKFRTAYLGEEFQVRVIALASVKSEIYRNPDVPGERTRKLYLLHDEGHFDLITKPTGYFGASYHCEDCDEYYSNENRHKCDATCKRCKRKGRQCEKTEPMECTDCHHKFNNRECYDLHKKPQPKRGTTFCQEEFICQDCGRSINMSRQKKGTKHVCGEFYCRTCAETVVEDGHRCYMKKLKPPAESAEGEEEDGKFIIFDFETYNDEELGHVPNFVCAKRWDGVKVQFPEEGSPMGGDVANDFCKWLFRDEHKGCTVIAHNFRGYDGLFILKYMVEQGLPKTIIRRNSQLLSLLYPKLKMKFRDTLNFLPMRLADMPKSLGVPDISKGDFPHKANRRENWDKIIDFPSPEEYGIDAMTSKKKAELLLWYEKEKSDKGGRFDFRKEIEEYCWRDVEVLTECVKKFRSLFFDACGGIDPFVYVTIAAACQAYYRTYVMEDQEIGIISANGYEVNRKTSYEAAQWLEWMRRDFPGLQHKRNGREKKFGSYFVDGYDPATKTVFEYNGDVFHGCPKHTKPKDKIFKGGLTMEDAYRRWMAKKVYLESCGLTVVEMWSCEWREKRETCADIKAFLATLDLVEPLKPKDAFKGGRTNAFKLFEECKDDVEKIKHIDIVSLYPTVNKHDRYPVGHPRIIVSEFGDVKSYFGLIKCVVECPAEDPLPILPMTIRKKLMFLLCQACGETGQDNCNHDGEKRYLHGTWATPELHYAVDNGYVVKKIHEVWHWETSKCGLFAKYVDTFMKIKTEASGWPAECVTEEQKDAYVTLYKEKEGIDLERDKVESNAGLKAVAKLMLNSFWGKFGQSDELTITEIIDEPKRYYELMTSPAFSVESSYLLTEDQMMTSYSKTEDYNEGGSNGNVVIAAFTTSWARLRLLEMMRKIGPERLLYTDTDSAMYKVKDGEWEPETGSMLGQWCNELKEGEHIVKFVSTGPKSYSYVTNKGRQVLKSKCIMQNGYTEDVLDYDENGNLHRTGKKLDFDALKGLLEDENATFKVIYRDQMKRDFKKQTIHNTVTPKEIRRTYDKRILRDDFTTLPFGTKRRRM